jgi:hypothetical protein
MKDLQLQLMVKITLKNFSIDYTKHQWKVKIGPSLNKTKPSKNSETVLLLLKLILKGRVYTILAIVQKETGAEAGKEMKIHMKDYIKNTKSKNRTEKLKNKRLLTKKWKDAHSNHNVLQRIWIKNT